MAEIELTANANKRATPIPNVFIDKYMPPANPSFVTVYLYIYRKWYWSAEGDGAKISFQSSKIAKDLDMVESDVLRALKYWSKMEVITFSEDGDIMTIAFPEIKDSNDKQAKTPLESITKAADEVPPAPSPLKEPSKKTVVMAKRPNYEVKEIDLYIKNSESVRGLFESAAKHLGKVLSYNDMSLIFSFHDWLRMPIDVIDTLLWFCTSNNNWSMRYIEKVAVDWADRGISSVESAKEHIRLYNTDFREIMKAMGVKNRDPVESEEVFMVKWLKALKMPLELIKEACNKTIMQIGKPNFQYTDQIIATWYQNKAQTIDDVRKLEEEHIKNRISAEKDKTQKNKEKKPSQNRFVNYEQRSDWDFDALEKMDRDFLDKELEGKKDD